MSSSEKLKALNAWFKDERNYGESWADASAELVVALPKIVAVVEEAEKYNKREGSILDQALSALEEALDG